MNRLSLVLFCAISLMGAYSQVPGTWLRDWQNTPNSLCSPDSFTVSDNGQTYSITYNFSALSLHSCVNTTVTGNYTAGLVVSSTTGNWVDSNGQQLVYDSPNNAVQFLFANSTPYLYDQNGSALPQQETFGYVGGTWINPTPLGSATLQSCCVPDNLFIVPADQTLDKDTIYVLPSFTSSSCSTVNTTQFANITVPSFQAANWTSTGYGSSAFANYIFDPSNTTYLTLTLSNGSSICGSYSYQKASGVNLLNNTWHLDWQSNNMMPYVPTTYQVLSVNNAYMITTLNYTYGDEVILQSYLVQDLQGKYYDSSVGLAFTYDSSTQTLLSIASSVSNVVLYSLNGSYFNDPLSESYWDNPQPIDNSPISSDCCTPYGISLDPTVLSGIFNIEYELPSDNLNSIQCTAFAWLIQDNTLYSRFYAGTPSTSSLSWTDEFGSQVYFTNTSGNPELTFENFLSASKCSFKLALTTTPPSPPLSSVLVSVEIRMFIMIGILMLLISM